MKPEEAVRRLWIVRLTKHYGCPISRLAVEYPKERVTSLKAIRDPARADSERTAAMPESSAQQSITPAMVCKFARTTRERMRLQRGGHRRDHLSALAQRVEVADKEVRIIGSNSHLLQTLAAAGA
jgi:site-specific DNA recombinase